MLSPTVYSPISPLSRPRDLRVGEQHSSLSELRVPPKPKVFQGTFQLTKSSIVSAAAGAAKQVKELFPHSFAGHILRFEPNQSAVTMGKRMNIGVVFAGGPIPGLEYLLIGLYAYLHDWNSRSKLFAFLNGPKGLINGRYILITEQSLVQMQSRVGPTGVGTGQGKIAPADFAAIRTHCEELDLDGLVIVGNPRHCTDAAHLAEYFVANRVKTSVIVTAKRYEGIRAKGVEMSFGFDSLCKHFSVMVGNVSVDASSAQSSWHFIRLVVDDAAALEVALQTHANVCIISEEVKHRRWTFLEDVVAEVCNTICRRSAEGKNYGIVLIPGGIVHATMDLANLIAELNDQILAGVSRDNLAGSLSASNRSVFDRLPQWVQEMLLGERDPHGAIDLSYVQIERFLAQLCEQELVRRRAEGLFFGKFGYQCHSYGYEGRCCHPSDFDASLACAMGFTAAALIERNHTSMYATVANLSGPSENWQPKGIPIAAVLDRDRQGNIVVQRSAVDLDGYLFKTLVDMRETWRLEDIQTGPVGTLSDEATATLLLEDLEQRHKQAGARLLPHEKTTEYTLAVRELFVEASSFKRQRLSYRPKLPIALRGAFRLEEESELPVDPVLEGMFGAIRGLPSVLFKPNESDPVSLGRQLTIGVVLSGGPAPGGHNVIAGLFDYLKQHNPFSKLLGFINGPTGLITANCMEITEEKLQPFRNQGGFNLIGTARTKIEKVEHFIACRDTVHRYGLDGLVICGGDDSNTNAALLANYFVEQGVPCSVIGVPKTIDADLRTDLVEMSFGFDTTTKVYAQLLSNICMEAMCTKSTYHFVRLMGRSASHICLECALRTHVNYCAISEEVEAKKMTLKNIVDEIVDIVVQRAADDKNYGVMAIPEGLIEFCVDMKQLIQEINEILAKNENKGNTLRFEEVGSLLTDEAVRATYASLPDWLRAQLMADRDPHGNVRVSAIESARLVAALVKAELEKRTEYTSKFKFQYMAHFLGYQGRCNLPSNFECNFAYTLGCMSGALVEARKTAVMAAIRNLTMPIDAWELRGVPLTSMMHCERRKGFDVPVIKKKLVDLDGPVIRHWHSFKKAWATADAYPGYAMDPVTSNEVNLTMTLGRSFSSF